MSGQKAESSEPKALQPNDAEPQLSARAAQPVAGQESAGSTVAGAAEAAGEGALSAPAGGPAAALALRDLQVFFRGSARPASTGIDLDLIPGRVLALVGESGSGKSVTAMGALGLLPTTATVTGSAVIRDGEREIELVGAPREIFDDVRGRLAGMIFQEPTTALDPLETIASQIGEAIAAHEGTDSAGHRASRRGSDASHRHRDAIAAGGSAPTVGAATGADTPSVEATGRATRAGDSAKPSSAPGRATRRRARHERVLELLHLAGLGEGEQAERIAASYPHQLSGGQLQRACIALAMASDPPVLIADEPTTALDVTVQADILDLLRDLTARGVAVLLITHDMGVVADVADDVAVMRAGRIVERGEVRELFAHPRHEYTRQLLAAVPRLDSLRSEDPFEVIACSQPHAATIRDEVVQIERLNVIYRNGRRRVHAVRDVSLSIAAGEILGLVGESGSGKSTIAGTLTGLVPVASGMVRVAGHEVSSGRRRDLQPARAVTGVVYQNPASSLNPRRTVGASIAEPLVVHGERDSAVRERRVAELLDAVRLPHDFAERFPHEMSGGQRQRVAIARALALNPRLVIADEPTSALDVSVQAVVLDLLRELQIELGFACLFVSHDLAVVEQMARRTVVLCAGQVVEEGATRQVLARPREEYTRRLVGAVPVPDPDIQARRRLAA